MNDNIILLTDSYKLSHFKQYPPKTQKVFSYFESRVGSKFSTTIFFGLQYFLKRYLEGKVVTRAKIDQAERVAMAHIGQFNRKGWEYILEEHDGRLPVVIKAVPEGMSVPESNVLMTIENTDPNCYWLTNYLETLLVQVWYPSTVCTVSRAVRKLIDAYATINGDPNLVDFKLHDFGFRGVSSPESAGLGGAAHLVNFLGTDTIAALECAIQYYGAEMPGFSIPASEHSTITSWGQDREVDAYRNMLTAYPEGLVACVSDSYDIDNAIDNLWGDQLKQEILDRNGTLVVRPDSGDPVSMVLNCLQRLGAKFGVETNEKGYRVLNPSVRLIQGDGCSFEIIKQILQVMDQQKWSVDNIAFGMGGGLLQKVDRDTQRFAFKCSSITIDREERSVFKTVKSDTTKASKGGRLSLINTPDGYKTVSSESVDNILEIVFLDGTITRTHTFDEIRERVK